MANTPSHDYFLSDPWISPLITAPSTRLLIPASRRPKTHNTEDSLLSRTLSTKDTIPYAISFYNSSTAHPTSAFSLSASASEAHSSVKSVGQPIRELMTAHALAGGLDGHPSILHGGIVATLLDEALGYILWLNEERAHYAAVALGHTMDETAEGGFGSFTVELAVKYRAPVKTPGTCLVRSWVEKKQGRRFWVRGVVEQKVGDEVVVCSEGTGLFIKAKPTKL